MPYIVKRELGSAPVIYIGRDQQITDYSDKDHELLKREYSFNNRRAALNACYELALESRELGVNAMFSVEEL